jgi:hypothetical protein
MPRPVTQVRIFAASPGDVQEGREALASVVEDLQHGIGDEKGLHLRLLRWETDTYPAMGRAQGIVNQQTGEYDVLVGIMWKRFGSPTGEADSGTEEEFNRAYARWQQTEQPHILFYFCERGFYARTQQEREQFERVQAFRDRLENSGLIGAYTTVDEFRQKVRRDLERVLRGLHPSRISPAHPPRANVPLRSEPEDRQPASRFTNIPLPQRQQPVSDLDKRRYVREGFSTIVAYFEDAAAALRQSNPALEVEMEQDTTRSLICEIFEHGQSRSRCRIWISNDLGSEMIAYGEGRSVGGGMNDWISATETANGLAFSTSGMDFSRRQNEVLDAEGAARHFWTRVTRPLNHPPHR